MSIEDRQADVVGLYHGLCYLSIVYPAFKIEQEVFEEMTRLMDKFSEAYEDNEECSEQETECLSEAEYLCMELIEDFLALLSEDESPQWYEEWCDTDTIGLMCSMWEDVRQLTYNEVHSLYIDFEAVVEPLHFSQFEEFKQHVKDFNINFIRIVTDGYDLEYGEGW